MVSTKRSYILKLSTAGLFKYVWPFSGHQALKGQWNINFFIENKLILSNQSGFKPGDSCINQLLSVTHEIYESFDVGLEIRSVFLDISKAFDKVWHDGIILKLIQKGIWGNVLNFLQDFLKERKQRLVLNGEVSTWKTSMLEDLRVSSVVLCCFWFTLMILQRTSLPVQS